MLDVLPKDIIDFLIAPQLSLKDRIALHGTCKSLRNTENRPFLLIEGRNASWKKYDMINEEYVVAVAGTDVVADVVDVQLFENIQLLVQNELDRNGRTKSFCRKQIEFEEECNKKLKISDPTLLLDPRKTRFYEEMMFFSWRENNVGPHFKGVQIFPPGFDESQPVHLWHNDAFNLANIWDHEDPLSFSRNPQLFTHFVITVGSDFIVPLPPLFIERNKDLVMTNYHMDLQTGKLMVVAHVRQNPLNSWIVQDLDVYAYIKEAYKIGMRKLERQFKVRVAAAYSTTKLALRGHDIEALFDPHLVINVALLGPFVRNSVIQLARTINAGIFFDGPYRFEMYEGPLTPPRIRLLGTDNVFPRFESLRPAIGIPGCHLLIQDRPDSVVLVDTISRKLSHPFPFPKYTGQSVIL